MNRTAAAVSIISLLLVPVAQGRLVLSDPDKVSIYPRIACGDDHYLVVWYSVDDCRTHSVTVGFDLQTVGTIDTLQDNEQVFELEVASNGEDFLVVWEALHGGGVINACYITPQGPSPPFQVCGVAKQAHHPTVASDGDYFLVAWRWGDDSIFYRTVYGYNQMSGIGEVGSGDYPQLVDNGTVCMLVYADPEDDDDLYGWRSDRTPQIFWIADGPCEGYPDVAWHADSGAYVVAFHNTGDSLVAVLLEADGDPVGSPVVFSEAAPCDKLSVAASDINFFVPWESNNDVSGQRMNPVGEVVGPLEHALVHTQTLAYHDPHVASHGDVFAVVYQEVDTDPNPDESVICLDGVSPYQKNFYSHSEYATAFNQARHIARVPSSDVLQVVYMTTGTGSEPAPDSVLYTHSTNGGGDWLPYEYVGEGRCPAVVDQGAPGVWIAYVDDDGCIVRAIRTGEGEWDYDIVYEAPTSCPAGPPSLAVSALPPGTPTAYVVYPTYSTSGDHSIIFNSFTASSISEPYILESGSAAADSPCVSVTPGDIFHVSWQDNDAIWYMEYDGQWPQEPTRVSTPAGPQSEPAAMASLEAYGDSVFCVWRGPDQGDDPGDVWRCSRELNENWRDPEPVYESEGDPSDCPVMSTDYLTVWHEDVDDPSCDIWAKFGENDPGPVFETELQSMFPHVASYWEMDPQAPQRETLHCLTVWTEATEEQGTYEVMFGDYVHTVQTGFDAAAYEPGTYYAVEVGGVEPSRYCTRRGGFREYRSFRVDTSASGLTYVLPYLDPRCSYVLRAVFYHEGKEPWSAELRGDSTAWASVTARPYVPETVWVRIPQEVYRKDARIELSLRKPSGGFVSLAGLKLFQTESRGGGYELAVVGGRTPSVRSFHASQNPFSTRTAICYSLAAPGRARVDILDAAGRVVCKLVDAELAAGEHRAAWSGRDDQGRAVAAGIYFCRLQTSDAAAVDRVVMLR
ncbi:MAG: hypothetical protein JSU73_01180 [candidate division WOR-3 bacterium]|nr:MAG: hypothetical protein JSU73_01180 [candidate division WOR-3 bacterium]